MTDFGVYDSELKIRYTLRNWFKDNFTVDELAFFLSSLSLDGALNMQKRIQKFNPYNKYYKDSDEIDIHYGGYSTPFWAGGFLYSGTAENPLYTATYRLDMGGAEGEFFTDLFDTVINAGGSDFTSFFFNDFENKQWYEEIEIDNDLYRFGIDIGLPQKGVWRLTNSHIYPNN